MTPANPVIPAILVIPAQAGIQGSGTDALGPGLRRDDGDIVIAPCIRHCGAGRNPGCGDGRTGSRPTPG